MKSAALIFCAGLLAGFAVQVAKYVLPDPATRILICRASDTITLCEQLKDIIERNKGQVYDSHRQH